MLYWAGKLTSLKSSIAFQLKPDLKLDDKIQLKKVLILSETASAKMTSFFNSTTLTS